MSVSRRSFLNAAPLAAAAPLFHARWPEAAQSTASPISSSFPTQAPELAQEMVAAAHGNIARVKELLARHSTLARAAWDWGFGDWEDALGAASHVGNRDIAQLLLTHGARPTIFSAAMFGHLDVVKGFIASSPGIESTPGPHGITLLSHAAAGGAAAKPVADYLATLPGANARPDIKPISAEQMKPLIGRYTFGSDAADVIAIALNANNILTITRGSRPARNLMHVGDLAFFPTGAPLVRIRFTEQSGATVLTVHDPDLVLTARRVS